MKPEFCYNNLHKRSSRKRIARIGCWLSAALFFVFAGALSVWVAIRLADNPNTLLTNSQRLLPIHLANGEVYLWCSPQQVYVLHNTLFSASGNSIAAPLHCYNLINHHDTVITTIDPSTELQILQSMASTITQFTGDHASLLLYRVGSTLPSSSVGFHIAGFNLSLSAKLSVATPFKASFPPDTSVIGLFAHPFGNNAVIYLTSQKIPQPPLFVWLKRLFPKLPTSQKTLLVLWLDPQNDGHLVKLGQLIADNKLLQPPSGNIPSLPLDMRIVPGGRAVSFVYNNWLYYFPLPTNAFSSS